MTDEPAKAGVPARQGLDKRIAALRAKGCSLRQIAQALGVSVYAVWTYPAFVDS